MFNNRNGLLLRAIKKLENHGASCVRCRQLFVITSEKLPVADYSGKVVNNHPYGTLRHYLNCGCGVVDTLDTFIYNRDRIKSSCPVSGQLLEDYFKGSEHGYA